MKNSENQVLLYYKYVFIPDPKKVMVKHRILCEALGLKGRIIIATEGINGTVEGTVINTQKYIEAMEKSVYFKDIHFKKSIGTGTAFTKLRIRVRPEIVTAGMPNLNPTRVTGKYLLADELHAWFMSKKEFYIVDMRNDFEYQSGYFEGFIGSGLTHFFNLETVLSKISHLKDKTIVTVCTGGIRCEKASGFLVENGFNDVYQLKDGIHTYMEQYPNQYFKGKLYVFDNRLTVGFNSNNLEIVGKCFHCQQPSDNYVNCEYNKCHDHHITCLDCKDLETGLFFCNKTCKQNYLRSKTIVSKHTIVNAY